MGEPSSNQDTYNYKVVKQFAVMTVVWGVVGILVGGTLHAFNLLLGVFAPTVHSLRLHYVEFFSKFLDLGGRRFEPWQKRHP